MIDSKYTNKKTVISRPTVSDKIDNLGKSGNKDSIKLVSTKDVENIVQKAQDNVNEVTINISKAITDLLYEPDEFTAKTSMRKDLETLDVHKIFRLHQAILRKLLHAK